MINNTTHDQDLDEKTINEIELVLSPLTNDDSVNFYDDDEDDEEVIFHKDNRHINY